MTTQHDHVCCVLIEDPCNCFVESTFPLFVAMKIKGCAICVCVFVYVCVCACLDVVYMGRKEE